MPEINLGENYLFEEDSAGDLVIRDTQSETVVARHVRDGEQWVLTESRAEAVGLQERSSAPISEDGVRKLYADESDGAVHLVSPDGSEAPVGGANDLASLSDVHKGSEEPPDPSDNDIWFVTR